MKRKVIELVAACLAHISASVSLAMVYVITLNRLLSTRYPFKFRARMTKAKFYLEVLIACSIVISLILAYFTQSTFYNTSTIKLFVVGTMVFLAYTFYIIFCIFSYLKIINTIQRSRRFSENPTGAAKALSRQTLWRTLIQHGFAIPLLITSTYLLFVALPHVSMAVCGYVNAYKCRVVHRVFHITWLLNNISDAIIYVLLDKDIRIYLRTKLTKTGIVKTNQKDDIPVR